MGSELPTATEHLDAPDSPPLRARRTAAIVVVLALALLAGAAAFILTGTTWTSRATVTIVPPQTDARSSTGENPLLRLDDDLPQLVNVLATSMQSSSANSTLRQQGGTASFTSVTGSSQGDDVAAGLTSQLRFTTEAGSSVLARRTAVALVSVARDQLDRLQTDAGVPGASRATITVLSAPTDATSSIDARWTAGGRSALAVVVVLGAGYLAVARRNRQLGRVPQR